MTRKNLKNLKMRSICEISSNRFNNFTTKFSTKNFLLVFLIGLILGVSLDNYYLYDYGYFNNKNGFDKSSKISSIELKPGSWVASTCFSPKGNCARMISDQIDRAKEEILVQAYTFTSKKIAQSLIEAKRRGVKTAILIDKSAINAKGNIIAILTKNGVEVFVDDVAGLAHNKVMIFDRRSVLTGSYNFTNAANDRNAENLLIVENKEFAKKYFDNWHFRKKSARGF
jgi:phospholipase D